MLRAGLFIHYNSAHFFISINNVIEKTWIHIWPSDDRCGEYQLQVMVGPITYLQPKFEFILYLFAQVLLLHLVQNSWHYVVACPMEGEKLKVADWPAKY